MWVPTACRLPCVVGVLLAMASTAAAATCETTGLPDVMFYTLAAATTTPASEGWVLYSACVIDKRVPLSSGGGFALDAPLVFQVLSVPTEATSISLPGSDLSRGADFSMAKKARTMSLSAAPVDARKFLLPPSLDSITFEMKYSAQLVSLDGVRFPTTLKTVTIKSSGLTSLQNVQFPSSLQSLDISNSPLSAIDFQLPASLKYLSFDGISFGNIDQLILPSGLESFTLKNGGTLSLRGVRWPATLKTFDFSQTLIGAFEIRESEVAIFTRLSTFRATVTQTACGSGASLQSIGSVQVCVLSDGDSTETTPSTSTKTRKPTTASGSKGGASASSAEGETDGGGDSKSEESTSSLASEGSKQSPSQTPSSGSLVSDETDFIPNDSVADGDGATTASKSNRSTSAARGRPEDAPVNSVTGSEAISRSSLAIILIVGGCVLTLIAGFIIYRVCLRANKRPGDDDENVRTATGKYTRTDTPTTSSQYATSREPPVSSTGGETISIDFRDDKELVRHRIMKVTIGKRIARGGYGIVYRGSYQGRVVAIKQMLPDAWRNGAMIAAFVDELRLCARLDHPKIVEFIGVSWTGVRDLSAVSEFMAGGDLHSVLHKYPESTGREWTRPWTTSNLRNKTLIALDVAEAIVYLHSFETPIIHRDLKTKNVLLDLVGNAKLSDFGISREMTVDETMTSEVGTAAWIAPEVLRGERYSEKADIYSLGVLLVELDRCSHPYANEPVLVSSQDGSVGRASTSLVAHKNTQIAILVSTGKLKPSPTTECPLDVAALVARCLHFEASDRPTAVEILHVLRRIRESQTAASAH